MNNIILEKAEDGNSYPIDVFSKLSKSRILFLCDHIDDNTASEVVAALLSLNGMNKEKITMYINSESGDIRSVLMIYDMMKLIRSPIETFCIGSATCEVTLLLAAGKKGMRYATKNSLVSIGQLTANYMQYGDLSNAEISHTQVKNDNDNYIKLLSKCINKPVKIIKKDCERKIFMTADESKKYGIIDRVISGIKK